MALKLLNDFGIDVLILPAHATHVLQVLDLTVNSVVKTELSKELHCTGYQYRLHPNDSTLSRFKQKRKHLFDALINAFHTATKPHTIQSGFSKSGISPFNPSKALNNPFIGRSEIQPDDRVPAANNISGKLLTSEEFLNNSRFVESMFSNEIVDIFNYDISDIIDQITNQSEKFRIFFSLNE
jgi:hypothetical protein